jgi:RNA-binding protein NOB1
MIVFQDSQKSEAAEVDEADLIADDLDKVTLEEDENHETHSDLHDTEEHQSNTSQPSTPDDLSAPPPSPPPLYEDPSDDDDGEGEWITPTNVSLHKSKALQLIPSEGGKTERVTTGCMTTDFAMQNVLLHMELSLVGVDGKKIDKVKTWVLRCHACFK